VDKLQALVSDLGISLLISTPSSAEMAAELHTRQAGLKVLEANVLESGRTDNPGVAISVDVPPYIGYTSGSTGKPKIISHHTRGLLDHQRVKTNEFGLVATDRWAILNPLSFGGGALGLYGALFNGATACLYDISSRGLQEIPAWMEKQAITIVNTPPPVFRNIFGGLPADLKFPSVRLILLSGDTMISQDVNLCRQHFSQDCTLSNMLALTEVGIVSRAFIKLSTETERTISVGYPFDGVEIKLFNETGQEVAPGEVGEIVVTSRFVSHDPLDPSDVQSGRVRVDPISGLRAVPSGDLGRIREDGSLEYLGRKDSVVKIRGLRVETAEVEAVLYQHPKVKEAAVMALESKLSGEKTLVAYIVPQPGMPPSLKELRTYLPKQLPFYMVPALFVFLEKIPLNSNGKVDRALLPEPDWKQPVQGEYYISPRNSVEWRLVQFWREVLKLERVGIRHDFFALGGDSLQALQLMARIKSEWDLDLPLQTMISRPTIADLASLINELKPHPVRTSISALRTEGDRVTLFMVPGGARTGISLMKFASRLDPGFRIYAVEYPGMEGYLEPMDQIEALAEFFLQQIRSVQPHGPYHLIGPCLGGVIVFEMAQQLTANGEKVGLLAVLDSTPPASDAKQESYRTQGYYRKRLTSLLQAGNFSALLWGLKSRLRRIKALLFLRGMWMQLRHATFKTKGQEWQDHRLDAHSQVVFDKLKVAKDLYVPRPYPGHGLVILSESAKETPRPRLWAELLKEMDCFYIPETSHNNIFDSDSSLDEIGRLINKQLPG
jgi:acyl-coenzyme A synthetase/AMP-(fatty) acid ligase/thioesterase domain-containing protein/acyl carrier protein